MIKKFLLRAFSFQLPQPPRDWLLLGSESLLQLDSDTQEANQATNLPAFYS